MNGEPMIEAYLQEFARQLRAEGRYSRRALAEIEDHLRVAIEEGRSQGLEPAAAAARAIERFGTPAQVIEQFAAESPLESEVEVMLRYLLMPVAAMAFVFGAALLIASWFEDPPSIMHITRLVASFLMLACSSILFYQGWVARPLATWERALTLAAALLSIILGSMGGVFTVHLGLVTRDWVMYGFAGAALLILQGVLAVTGPVMNNSPLKPAV